MFRDEPPFLFLAKSEQGLMGVRGGRSSMRAREEAPGSLRHGWLGPLQFVTEKGCRDEAARHSPV